MQPGSSGGTRARIRVTGPDPRPRLPGRRSLRLLKWFGWTTLGFVWVVIVVVVAVPLLIDWNTFKPELVEAVRQATGRELSVGSIEVAFRPLPTVELSELRLASQGDAAAGPLAAIPEARASLRLLPLLGGELIIREITIHEPAIDLRIDREGNPNWRLASASKSGEAAGASTGASRGLPVDSVVLEAIAIEHGSLRFEHTQLDQRIQIDDLNLDGVVDARGSNLASFMQSLEAKLALTVGSMTATDLLINRVDGLRAAVTVPKDLGEPSFAANARISLRDIDESAEVGLSGRIGRLTKLLAGEEAYPFDLKAHTGQIEATLTGQVHDPLGSARPEFALEVAAPTLAAFAPFIDLEAPDLGPFDLKLRAAFAGQDRLVVDTLESHLAGMQVSASGAISDADSADPKPWFEVRLSGRTLAELRPVLGSGTPDLGPFSIAAEVASAGQQVTIRDLAAKLARSDLAGEAAITLEPPRPRVDASLTSERLDLAEIRTAVAGEDGTRPGTTSFKRGRHLFPNDPLPFEALRLIDLNLGLEISELLVDDSVQLTNTALKLALVDSRLTIDPFATRLASGDLKGTFEVNARSQPATLALALNVDRIEPGELLRGFGLVDLGAARLDGSLDLTAQGASPQQIADSLGGKTFFSGQGGQLKLGSLISGVAKVFRPLLRRQEDVSIACFINRFAIESGVMTSQVQMLSTREFAVAGSGTINLGENQLDLKFTTAARRPSLASFAVPFRVRGPITAPSAYADPLGSVFTAVRVAGMVLDPITLVETLVAADPDEQAACEAAIRRAARGDAAPPVGPVDRALEDIGRGVEHLFGE